MNAVKVDQRDYMLIVFSTLVSSSMNLPLPLTGDVIWTLLWKAFGLTLVFSAFFRIIGMIK